MRAICVLLICIMQVGLSTACTFQTGDGTGGGETKLADGTLTGVPCVEACMALRKTDPTINGVTVNKNNAGGCWCEKGMTSVNTAGATYKACFLPAATTCWTTRSPGCVKLHNLKKYAAQTVATCKQLCLDNAYCVGFEFGVPHGGSSNTYKTNDCQLTDKYVQSSLTSCDGKKNNLDRYIKTACVAVGTWSVWGNYGVCSKVCGSGTQYRSRTCTGTCNTGSSTDQRSCNTQACAVLRNGAWSNWGSYGSCSRTCGGGSQTRSRSCNNPTPAHGGASCGGSSTSTLVCNSALCPGYGDQVGSTWNYRRVLTNGGVNAKGPANWHNKYTYCNDWKQSPVNVATKHVSTNKELGNITMQYYDTEIGFTLTNNNKGLILQPKVPANGKLPQTVTFGGKTYRLSHIDFHWGSTNIQGSEHTVDWQQYAGEVHFVHYSTVYDTYAEAAKKTDGILVWAHFMKVDSENKYSDTEVKYITDALSHVYTGGKSYTPTYKITVKSLLPHEAETFYQMWTYKGSFTSPPCTESVIWVINTTPLLMSTSQMTRFRSLKDAAMGNNAYNVDNYRPIQPRNKGNSNTRYVYRNWKETDIVCNSAVSIKPLSAVILAVIVGLFFRM